MGAGGLAAEKWWSADKNENAKDELQGRRTVEKYRIFHKQTITNPKHPHPTLSCLRSNPYRA
jgi:hypothetical protein